VGDVLLGRAVGFEVGSRVGRAVVGSRVGRAVVGRGVVRGWLGLVASVAARG